MFAPSEKEGYREVIAGIRMKTLVHGEKTLMAEFRLTQGAVLPAHQHSHEQTGYLVSGRIDLTIDGVVHAVRAGDSWCIPGGAAHSAKVHEDAVAVEVFAPVREDYLP